MLEPEKITFTVAIMRYVSDSVQVNKGEKVSVPIHRSVRIEGDMTRKLTQVTA